jgi:hypothetical protein
MCDGKADRCAIVDRDRRQGGVLQPAVHQDDRQAGRGDIGQQHVIQLRCRRDQAVDAIVGHRLEVVALAFRVVVGVDDQRGVPRGVESVLDSAHHRGKSGFVRSGICTPMV